MKHLIGSLAPNGMAARIVLSIVESAGILYANISPVIVSGLVQSGGFDGETAGYVYSSNMYGTALGGLLVIFVIQRLNWRYASAALLVLLISLDTLSALVGAAELLYGLRFAHGLIGGMLIGVALSVIARMASPERTIAVFIMLQLVLGGVLTILLMPLIASSGTSIIWLPLIAFSGLALLVLPLLGPYPISARSDDAPAGAALRAPWRYIAVAMIGLFAFQCGQMAAFVFVIEIGRSYLFGQNFISTAVAMSLWIGGPAALFVTWWSTRSGRFLPMTIAVAMTALSVAVLLVPRESTFLLANIGFGIFFSVSFPYLMGVASELDNVGSMGALAGFIGNFGLASGPAFVAYLAGSGQYQWVIVFAVAAMLTGVALVGPSARMLDRKNRTGRVHW